MVIHYTNIYNNVVFPDKKACIFRFKGRKSCANGDSVTDVQYFVANSRLLHVGPTDAVESQDQEFEVLDIKVRPTANDNALVLVARYKPVQT